MSAELKVLNAEPAVHPDVIAMLTEVCAWVERDEVSSVAIAVVRRDGAASTCWSKPHSLPALIGAVERLKHRLLTSVDE
jgi:hypothetical protein